MRRIVSLLSASLVAIVASQSLLAADWQPKPGPLMTRWAKDVDAAAPHPDYPRPQMVREKWHNLNGLWQYAVTGADAKTAPEKFDGQILVPFPIESSLSGVMRRVDAKQKLWYARTFKAPELNGGRLLLHFGAVDWKCEVFVNGKRVGEHTGGYDPFSFDVTDALKAGDEQRLSVVVHDPTDANWQPRGKQIQRPHGIWYTPITGIWQTVWLEPVPKLHIQSLKIEPDIDNDAVHVTVNASGDAQVTLSLDKDHQVTGAVGKRITLKVDKPKLWTPDTPHLYDLRVALGDGKAEADSVDTYFGMRKIALAKDDRGVLRLALNNKPLFQYGPLDQGFWPDGLYTAPTDAALVYDLEITKKLGFNMVRKHVKVEPARWYYHCDKLGLLVWQDMPSGDRYVGNGEADIQRTKESAENFENEWREIVQDNYNSPSIVMWVPFNEGWGQFDTARIAAFTRQLDPSRLVNSASGWTDRKVGDVHDIHVYPGPAMPPVEEKRAAVLGEFGGLGLPLEGHTWQAKDNWGYKSYESKEALNSAYLQLVQRLRPLIGQGLAAAVYTQTTDVEIEVNGFMTYDRAVMKFDVERAAAAHRKLYLPPPQVEELVATSQKAAAQWRYTFEKPGDEWYAASFDDSSWKEGPAGFGEPSTPGSVVRTSWKTPDIWLRRTVNLKEKDFTGAALVMHHDEDTEVYINGKLITKATGWSTEYSLFLLDDKAVEALKSGENVIAVHTHQKGGGQYIDLGLIRMVEAK